MDKFDVLLHVTTATKHLFADVTLGLTFDWPVDYVNASIVPFQPPCAAKFFITNRTLKRFHLLMDIFRVPFKFRRCSTLHWANATLEWFDVLMDKFDVFLHVATAAKNLFTDGTWQTFYLPVVPANVFIMNFHC